MTQPTSRVWLRDTAVVEAELQHLQRQLERLERRVLEPELFKKVRLQYGIYSQRHAPEAYMVRVRPRLGRVTPLQLEELAAICEQLTPTQRCHLTTRQGVQLYGIKRWHLVPLLRRLASVGLTTREASGNVVRNITCCPWAGIAPDEPFDVTPYALALSAYLLRNPLAQLLPRKVKIAFEGCPTDHARVAIHDIGIEAARQHGEIGFRIYAGGGLGPVPRAAQLVEPWTPAEQLVPTVEAILRVFDRSGERRNRSRARLKFFIEQCGWAEFQRRVLEERNLVWATQSGHALRIPTPLPEELPTMDGQQQALPAAAAFAQWAATNVSAQKQPGAVTIIVRIPLGDVTPEQLRGLAQVGRQFAGGIRLMNTQNVLLRFVPRAALSVVFQALHRIGLAEGGAGHLADVTRCPGADSCLSAITRPRGLAAAIEASLHDGWSAWISAPLSIKISGCPNACGQHHIADIGCFGVAVRVGERYAPCYQLLVGGQTSPGQARFGQPLLRIPARRVPDAVQRLVQWYGEQRRDGETFGACVERSGLPPLRQLCEDLAELTSIPLAPELSVDLGASEPYQPEAGKGECAE